MTIIERIRRLHFAAGQWPTEHIRDRESGTYECPACGGEGSIEAELVHRLHAGCVGMQVYGIGDQMAAMEKLMPLLMEHLPALLDVAESLDRLSKQWREKASKITPRGSHESIAADMAEGDTLEQCSEEVECVLAKLREAKP